MLYLQIVATFYVILLQRTPPWRRSQ